MDVLTLKDAYDRIEGIRGNSHSPCNTALFWLKYSPVISWRASSITVNDCFLTLWVKIGISSVACCIKLFDKLKLDIDQRISINIWVHFLENMPNIVAR
jgi:hypothetical protein